MLFLSKLLPLFIYPLGLSLTLAVFACLLLWRKKRVGLGLLVASILILWLASTTLVSHRLVTSLEWRHLPVATDSLPSADAIILLGGAVSAAKPPRVEIELHDAADRVLHAARLYRAGKAPMIIVSGGALPWLGPYPEAPVAKALLQEWGVPADAILLDSDSRNTYENAMNSKRLAQEHHLKKILLVTSALHMPRAMATFQAAGIRTIAAPTASLVSRGWRPSLLSLLPDASALMQTTLAVKEYVGLLYYRWRWGVGG